MTRSRAPRRARDAIVAPLCAGALVALATRVHADEPPALHFTAEQIAAGHHQFDRTCAQCHGRNMVNSGTTVYDLRRFPRDQPERFLSSVTNGKGNMPAFRDALTHEQMELLWAYVASRGGKEP
jgi:cytochrome c6